ncbi:MAG: alpha/beta hydrolase-fold protein [Bacteroidia bacterium]
MKNLIPFLLILFIASCKKEEFNPNLTKEFSIQSVSNGANYNIKVALPDNYNASEKYATIYVLDGEENFSYVADNCKKLSDEYATSNILVVSIGYGNDRAFDYTPTKANEGGGGAEKFMAFIKNELIPKMESDYGADTLRKNRIILGHSFGGLFAAYAFTNYNNVFGNYIMLSPSVWYDDEIMLRLEQENRDINKNNHQLVFMGLGELENEGRMLAPFMALFQRMQNNYFDMQIASHLEPHQDHNGSKNPNISAGLKFYFQNK